MHGRSIPHGQGRKASPCIKEVSFYHTNPYLDETPFPPREETGKQAKKKELLVREEATMVSTPFIDSGSEENPRLIAALALTDYHRAPFQW